MSLPPSLRNNFSPLELEFVAEETYVEIVPSVRLPKTRLLSGVSLERRTTDVVVGQRWAPTISANIGRVSEDRGQRN